MAGPVRTPLQQGHQLLATATQLRAGGNMLAASLAFGEAARVFATGPHGVESLSAATYRCDALYRLVHGYQQRGDFAAGTAYHGMMRTEAAHVLEGYGAALVRGEPGVIGGQEVVDYFTLLQGAAYTALHTDQWLEGVRYADLGLGHCAGLRVNRPIYVARYGEPGGRQNDRFCEQWECLLNLVKGYAFLEGALRCCLTFPVPPVAIRHSTAALTAYAMARALVSVAPLPEHDRPQYLHGTEVGLFRAATLLRYVALTEPERKLATRTCATWRTRFDNAAFGALVRQRLMGVLDVDLDYAQRVGPELNRAAYYINIPAWSRGLDPVVFFTSAAQAIAPLLARGVEESPEHWIEATTLAGRIERRLGHYAEAIRLFEVAARVAGPHDMRAAEITAELQAARARQPHALDDEDEVREATVHVLSFGNRR